MSSSREGALAPRMVAVAASAILLAACGARTGLEGLDAATDGSPGGTAEMDARPTTGLGREVPADGGWGSTGPDADVIGDAGGDLRDGAPRDGGPRDDGSAGGATDAHGIVEVAAGDYHTCARRRSGEVLCWGANDRAQAGLRGPERVLHPRAVAGTGRAVAMALGRWHSCVLRDDRRVLCWGGNQWAQVGAGTGALVQPEPTLVPGLRDVRALAAGWVHTCALRADGSVWCWGRNDAGQLGMGRVTLDRPAPSRVVDLDAAAEIDAGRASSCARLRSGAVRCWGLGVPWPSVPLLEDALRLSTGDGHACVVRSGGAMQCWGDMGCGAGAPAPGALLPRMEAAIVAMGGGYAHHCAAHDDGSLACWGAHDRALRSVDDCWGWDHRAWAPELIALPSAARDVAAGFWHTCVLHDPGLVSCWGANAFGQLADGTTAARPTPVAVAGLR